MNWLCNRTPRPSLFDALRARFHALRSRLADVSINTVTKLLVQAGEACEAFHDGKVRNVKARRVHYKKRANST